MEKNQRITVVEAKPPAELIELAINKGNIDLDKLEKLMRLQREHEADIAKKAYNENMVKVQEEIPLVSKKKKNNQTNSKYASLDDIIATTKKIYTKYGFSVSFYEGDKIEGMVRICADVVHGAGHKETYHYDVPLDGVGIKGNANMTAIHAKASSTSYARRYLMCMIWNIPTEDDDGQAATIVFIDENQKSQLVDMLAAKNIPISEFCTKFKIKEVSELPKSKFQKVVTVIKSSEARK